MKGHFAEESLDKYDDSKKSARRSKRETKDLQHKVKRQKFCDRFYFTLIIWIEQLCMYGGILYASTLPNYPKDFTLSTFFPLSVTIFLLGQILEWLVHLLVFPFAKYRARYELRRNLLFAFISICLAISIGILARFSLQHYPNFFVPIVVFACIMIISLMAFFLNQIFSTIYSFSNTICCVAKDDIEKDEFLENDAVSNASGSYESLLEFSGANNGKKHDCRICNPTENVTIQPQASKVELKTENENIT